MTKYKIIDNFLPNDFYEKLSFDLKSDRIPWYYKKVDVDKKKSNNNGFFCFCYYNDFKPDHHLFNVHIEPILKNLNAETVIIVKANLVLRDKDMIDCAFHTDTECLYSTTGILFLTDCNSKTILKVDNKEVCVNSIENRMLLFNSQIEHKVIYQTDVYKRYVINFNFIERKSDFYNE